MRVRVTWGWVVAAVIASAAVGMGLFRLVSADAGLDRTGLDVAGTPVTVTRLAGAPAGPVVVIAHGFAGSRQIMQPIATSLARAGYVAVTFDLAGHGRNPAPLTGSIVDIDGATMTLVRQTAQVADATKGLGDGRLAVLGHSMSSDIVVRLAQSRADVAATIALSMFSPAVEPTSPRNLLVIVGDWEPGLKDEALRVAGLVSAPAAPVAGTTYGVIAEGTARRAVFAPGVEHVSILYSETTMRESVAWLDAVFGVVRARPAEPDRRGPWLALLLAGAVMSAWPLSRTLPRLAEPPLGAGLTWRRLWWIVLVPALVTPVILRVLPTHFLPVLVADYLAMHFLVYGLLTAALMGWAGVALPREWTVRFWLATLAAVAFAILALFLPLDVWFASFVPTGHRLPVLAAMLVGTLAFFVPVEWMTRGAGHARLGYASAKTAFVVSLFMAVALDFDRLMFLAIIVPFVILFFLVFGLMSDWLNRATGHPLVGAIFNAVAFAWAIAVTFPLLAG
jgi:pimeloyl-ACP methyl ester carboxylesterase